MNTMTTPEQRVETSLELLKAVLLALCKYPDKLEFDTEERAGSVQIRITCHPTDSRRIVGKLGTCLRALDSMARLLFWGSHLLVTFLPIKSTADAESPKEKFEPRADWPEERLKDLLHDLAAGVFRDCAVRVESTIVGHESNNLTVWLDPFPAVESHVVRRFASSVAILFVPIGTNHGRRISADVATK